ncbi:MAG: tail fiber domain-containing protein [Bacteroidota bacterium]
MKKVLFTIASILLLLPFSYAQPEAFKYQAAVRDGSGQVMMNQSVNFRINIIQTSFDGPTVYIETHAVNTNDYGLANLEIGSGVAVSGNFAAIAWDTDRFFIKVELDPAGGSSFQDLGTTQLLSVPYALHAKTAGSVPGDNDQSVVNEIQSLSLSGNTLSIAGANSVDLSDFGSLWETDGNDIYYNTGDVGINTVSPEFDFHINGELFVNTSAGRLNLGLPNNGNQWRMSTQGSGANLQFQSKPTGSFTYTRRVYFNGTTGNVAIGNNSNPDEELVVGTNLGSGWAIPAVTVGGTTGGVFQAGNADYQISMENSSTFGRARIIVTSPTGFGRGEVEMRTNGLTVGENAGSPGSYMLNIEHGSFGVNFARASTTNNWEFVTSSAAASNLNLYANGTFRGSFSGTDGSWNPSSDRSLKTNVKPIGTVLSKLMQVEPSRYQYIDNNPTNKESIGFIAQDFKAHFPELVFIVEDERSKGVHALNYSGMSVLAIKAIQEQQQMIDNQQEEIDELKARLAAIEAALSEGSE